MAGSEHALAVLFVCLGNICRSPTAQAAFERTVQEAGLQGRIRIDSAGTAAYHVGEPPDLRSVAAGEARGLSFAGQRARQLQETDLDDFDYVLAMDHSNLAGINALAASAPRRAQVGLFLNFADGADADEVPDPYYGGSDGFDRVIDLVDAAAAGLLRHLRQHYELGA